MTGCDFIPDCPAALGKTLTSSALIGHYVLSAEWPEHAVLLKGQAPDITAPCIFRSPGDAHHAPRLTVNREGAAQLRDVVSLVNNRSSEDSPNRLFTKSTNSRFSLARCDVVP